MKNIVILYHGNCPDGFGGAYAAWKKFGDSADYIAVYHGDPPPKLENKEVYIIDFSYPDGKLLEIEKAAKRLVVLDHHEGAEDVVRQVREHVYDSDRSGCAIAWYYFHPDRSLPRLLAHIQDVDLWKFLLTNTAEIAALLETVSFDFIQWDTLKENMERDDLYAQYIEVGTRYKEFFDHLCADFTQQAQEANFDKYRVMTINAPRRFASAVGNILAKKYPPFSIVWYYERGSWQFSLRGTGEVDLATLAKKYGGGGHHNASGFHVEFGKPFPFTFINK